MSDFPIDFNEEELTQPQDRELEKIVKSKFGGDVSDYVLEKYQFDPVGGDFGAYAKKVKSLVAESKTAGDFFSRIVKLNEEQHIALF